MATGFLSRLLESSANGAGIPEPSPAGWVNDANSFSPACRAAIQPNRWGTRAVSATLQAAGFDAQATQAFGLGSGIDGPLGLGTAVWRETGTNGEEVWVA